MEIPASYYAASRGAENLANSMTALGNTFMALESERRQKEAAAMRLAETSKFVLSVTQDVDKLFTEAERDKPENISKWQQPIADKFQEYWEYINGIQDDPQLKALVTSKHVELQTAYGKKFNDLATKKNHAFAQTQFFNSYDYFLKGYLNAGDEQTESMHMTNLAEAISRAETGGVISPELGNRARNDMEKAINRKTVTKLEGTIAAADELTPEQMVAFRSSLVDPQQHTALTATDRRVLLNQATTIFQKVMKERAVNAAYSEAAATWKDPRMAMVEVLKPGFMQKHGMTLDQVQNMSQSFSIQATQGKLAEKDRQEANLDQIRGIAITDPAKALRLIADAQDVDPKDALTLKTSIESHIRQMSLMSAQEKSLMADMEDKIKARIKNEISTGKYKDERQVVNAVIREGLTNTSGFIDDALGNFREYKKEAGAINYFKSAEEDWEKLISVTKNKGRKKELQTMKIGMLTALQNQMQSEGVKVSDPKVFEMYKVHKKALTDSWFTKAIDSIWPSSDTMVKPEAAAPSPAAITVMDEATARKKLTEKKVTGRDQDMWIKRYRDNGVVK